MNRIDEGDILEIGCNQVYVCYKTTLDEENYMITAIEDETITFEIYKYKFDNERLFVSKVEDEEEVTKVFGTFMADKVDEYGIPEDLQRALEEYISNN